MRIVECKERSKKKKPGLFITMSKEEALHTIESLASQIRTDNPNYNRLEDHSTDGRYFTIAVNDETAKEKP